MSRIEIEENLHIALHEERELVDPVTVEHAQLCDRREAIRKQIVDAAYDNAMRVILSHGATHTIEERTYLQAMLIERLAKGLCMETMSQVFRQEIEDAEK